MKKALLILAFCLLCAALCQGCGLLHHDAAKPTEAPSSLPATEAPTPEPTAEPTAPPTEAPTAEPTPEPTAEPTAPPTEPPYGLDMELSEYALRQLALAETRMDQAIRHIRLYPINIPSTEYSFVPADKRSGLTYEEAALYDDMLAAALEFKSIPLEGSDESVENALEALMFDHPEIEVYYTAVKEDGGWKTVCFVPEARYFAPTDDIETVKEQANAFKAVGAYVASRIPEDFSVIDKYRLLAYYISITTEYAHVHGEIPRYATCAYGALIKGGSICQGYALGFEYLCRAAGLNCRRVRNAFNDENMHFWDIVTLDQGTYYVDVTWCDGSAQSFAERSWFSWFMFTADEHHVSNDGASTTGYDLPRWEWK